MDLGELQNVKDTERGKDSLQHLEDSFYSDVAEHIAGLKDERDERATAADDPFGDPEVQQLTSEIDATEQVVNSIYERRVGKLVKLASFAAADMPADEEGLTSEEQQLFADLVTRIKDNRAHVLDVLAGDATGESVESVEPVEPVEPVGDAAEQNTTTGTTSAAETESSSSVPEGGVSAADLMGDGSETDDISATAGAATDDDTAPEQTPSADPELPGPPVVDSTDQPSVANSVSNTKDTDEVETVERATLRITRDVGEILGLDNREYDLATDDVVSLPEANAGALVEREAAERLD